MNVKYEPQKQYADHQKSQGMVQVTVWVPEDSKDQLKTYAKSLRAARAVCEGDRN